MDIYIEKRPEDARHLLKYVHNIREMYDLYGGFMTKDLGVYGLPWGKIVDELYTKAANACNRQRDAPLFRLQTHTMVHPKSDLGLTTNSVGQNLHFL